MSFVDELIAVGKSFSERNWIVGAAGNFSAAVSRQPFELVITKSGADRRALTNSDFVHLDKSGRSLDGQQVPSETPVHWAIISNLGAGAVLQTHSVWSRVLADVYAVFGGVELEGFEALSGLSPLGASHHREWVPILENSEDYRTLVAGIERVLKSHPEIRAMILQKHGLYTWGKSVTEAVRYVEIFEFLFEVFVRQLHISAQFENRGSLT